MVQEYYRLTILPQDTRAQSRSEVDIAKHVGSNCSMPSWFALHDKAENQLDLHR